MAESFQEQAEWFLRNLWIFHFSSNFVLHVRQAKALGYKRLVVQRGRGSHRVQHFTFTLTLPPRSLVRWKVEPTRSTDSGRRVQHLERWRKDFYFKPFHHEEN